MSANEEAAKLLKDGLKFKPVKAGVKPTGPGSKRGEMDPRAWESRQGKGPVAKSAFEVEHGTVSKAMPGLAAVARASKVRGATPGYEGVHRLTAPAGQGRKMIEGAMKKVPRRVGRHRAR